MKTIIITSILLANLINCFSQTLIENVEGDELVFFQNGRKTGNIFGNFNVSDKSIQLSTTLFFEQHHFLTIGLKGKPSDGNLNFLTGGTFSPNTTIDITYSNINQFFDIKDPLTDFWNLKVKYTKEEITLFNPSLPFDSQISDSSFDGIGLLFNYNILLKGAHLFSITSGYQKRNNYSKLKAVEVKEFSSNNNSNSTIVREYGRTINAKLGEYIEEHTLPLKFAYSYLPSEDTTYKDKMLPGFTFYYSSILGNFYPNHNIGLVLFLTKQDEKTGIRSSVIGLGFQLNDMFNIYENSTSIVNSISLNLTSTINLFSL